MFPPDLRLLDINKVMVVSRSYQGQGHFKVSHTSHMSPLSHCISNILKYQEKKKKEDEFASTRPVGFAVGKNSFK